MRRALQAMLLCALTAAQAQDPFDTQADRRSSDWRPIADLLLRGDRVSGLPGGREDLERLRMRLRFGMQRAFGESDELGLVLRAAAATEGNLDTRINLDNERSRGLWLDELWWRRLLGPRDELLFGKAPLPLRASPLWWDEDLRPAGLSWQRRLLGPDHSVELDLVLGGWRLQHLFGDRTRMAAAQLRVQRALPSGVGLEASFGWVHFGHTERLVAQGLARGNRVDAGRHLSDFRLLVADGALRSSVSERPLELRITILRNLGALRSDLDDAARLSATWGDRRAVGGLELGVAWQRMQRESVLAAVSDDDWWFHTAARGVMPWIGYGWGARWSVRVSAFRERRDDLASRTRRVLLDLGAEW